MRSILFWLFSKYWSIGKICSVKIQSFPIDWFLKENKILEFLPSWYRKVFVNFICSRSRYVIYLQLRIGWTDLNSCSETMQDTTFKLKLGMI